MEIRYTSNDLVKTRFRISPLSVASMSAKVFYNSQHYPQYSSWTRYVHEALDGMELPVLSDFHRGAVTCNSDLLEPFPVHEAPSIQDELQQVATLSEGIVEDSIDFQLTMDPPEADLRKYKKHPRLLRERVVDELELYWQHVIEPHWKQIRMVLETDILQRSRRLVASGYEVMIMGLDPRITAVAGRLYVQDSRHQTTIEMSSRGIIFNPNVFSVKTRIGLSPAGEAGVILSYAADGSGNWRDNRSLQPPYAMSMMLGEHRSRLLCQLQRPMTTSELAASLHLTTSAISQQLKQLYEADLVHKHRVGKRVYYRLNERGESLLNVFESKSD